MTTKWVACSPSMTCASQYACTQTNRAEGRERRGCGTTKWQSIGLRHRGRTYVPETLVQADRSTSFAPCCEDRNSSNPRNFSERYSQTARWQATAGNSRHRAHTKFQLITLLSLTRRRTTKPCSRWPVFLQNLASLAVRMCQ